MPEWTLRRFAWRTAAAELDVGKNPGVLVLTNHCAFTLLSWSLASYFLVGCSPAWTLAFRRRRRGMNVRVAFFQKVATRNLHRRITQSM